MTEAIKADEMMTVRADMAFRVLAEIDKSIVKHGEQSLPLFCNSEGNTPERYIKYRRANYAEGEQEYKLANDLDAERGSREWAGIILEEVYEALAETDPKNCVTELLQSAAMCIKAAADIEVNGLR